MEGGFDVSEKTVIVPNVNYVSQFLATRDAQRAVGSVLDEDLLCVMMYNMRKQRQVRLGCWVK